MTRSFADRPARRESMPLMLGLWGPSGGGKTLSALRLAAGIRRVVDGDVFVIDTEGGRSLHYADAHEFRHVDFLPPFGPDDYCAAVEHCVTAGARTIVIDSCSHEHEGPGGVLEMHAAEVERLSRGNAGKADRVKMLAWVAPKQARRRLINRLLQIRVNVISCWRAKERLDVRPGREPTPMGWAPIGGDEWIYEQAASAFLPAGASGRPQWRSDMPAEVAAIKLPAHLAPLFGDGQITEDTGERLARWAAGDAAAVPASSEPSPPTPRSADAGRPQAAPLAARLLAAIADARSLPELGAVASTVRDAKGRLSPSEIEQLAAAYTTRSAALRAEAGQ